MAFYQNMYFNFSLYNPFCKKTIYKNIFAKYCNLPIKNKYFEFEIAKHTGTLLKLQLELNFKGCDHAGPEFSIGIFGYEISARIYDHRHWDYKNNKWEKLN